MSAELELVLVLAQVIATLAVAYHPRLSWNKGN